MTYRADSTFANELDQSDLLARFRRLFHIPIHEDANEGIYLCGHSLGLQPKSVKAYVDEELAEWGRLGVEGHFHARHPWMPYHELLTEQTARLVGARPVEVVVMNTLTVNLHLMMVSFYRPTQTRHKIVVESNAFPSDQYAVKSQLRFHGFDSAEALIELHPREGETSIRTEDIESFLEREGKSVALVMLGGVNYYSGQVFDMERITRAAHAQGCMVGFDLAHAAGNIPLKLHDWGPDFAVWCSYKYLNAGPGSSAGCFVHERHSHSFDLPRFAGWWGTSKAERFKMGPTFEPIPGAEGWQISNPPILPLAALRASMEIFDEVGMERLRGKSEMLTGYLEYLVDQRLNNRVRIITLKHVHERGCQLSLVVSGNARGAFKGLMERGVICDWREPDVIRVAPVPLYNSFRDVFEFVNVFREVLEGGGREAGDGRPNTGKRRQEGGG